MRKMFGAIWLFLLTAIPMLANENGHGATDLPFWSVIPFVLMLLAIAILPLTAEHWWEDNKNKLIVSAVLGIPMLIYLYNAGMTHEIKHTIIFDYIPFIILLWSLFYISGGIVLRGDL